jgi:hypothetical protein
VGDELRDRVLGEERPHERVGGIEKGGSLEPMSCSNVTSKVVAPERSSERA